MKLKPREEDYYEIIGYREEMSIHDEPKNRLGSLECQTGDEKPFYVGSGFTDEQRETLWYDPDDLIGKYARVKYPEITYRGVPWQPIIIDIVDVNPEESVCENGST